MSINKINEHVEFNLTACFKTIQDITRRCMLSTSLANSLEVWWRMSSAIVISIRFLRGNSPNRHKEIW